MMQLQDLDVQDLKDIPGYKAILKAVIKSQIQGLVEQLADQTGEESVILTASTTDSTLCHLGSLTGKHFLEGRDEIKSQFLRFCLKNPHKKNSESQMRSDLLDHEENASPHSDDRLHPSLPKSHPSISSITSPSSVSQHNVHPVALTRVGPSPGRRSFPGRPYSTTPPHRQEQFRRSQGSKSQTVHTPSSSNTQSVSKAGDIHQIDLSSENVKLEQPSEDPEDRGDNYGSSVGLSSSPQETFTVTQIAQSSFDDGLETENRSEDKEKIRSDIASLVADSGDIDTSHVKIEPVTEGEMDLEITGIEMAGGPDNFNSDGNWVPNVSNRLGFDSSTSGIDNVAGTSQGGEQVGAAYTEATYDAVTMESRDNGSSSTPTSINIDHLEALVGISNDNTEVSTSEFVPTDSAAIGMCHTRSSTRKSSRLTSSRDIENWLYDGSYVEYDSLEENFNDSGEDPDYKLSADQESIVSEDDMPLEGDSYNHAKLKNPPEICAAEENRDYIVTASSKLQAGSISVTLQSSKNTHEKRVWDKMHFCFFCGNSSTNIRRHFFGPHRSEPEVQKILNCPKNSEKRKLELLRLRNAGDYKHNAQVLKSGEGTIVTWSRKSSDEKVSADNYLPCEDCLAFFSKPSLWRHRQVCPFKKNGSKFQKVQSEASLLLPASVEASKSLRKNVLSRMNDDEITFAAQNDHIIIKVGERLYQKYRDLPNVYNQVSQKMRELGRFLIAARTQDVDIKSLSDVLAPEKYPIAVTATKILCGYSEQATKYVNPSLALKMGRLLKKCAKIKMLESLLSGDSGQWTKIDEILTLLENKWSDDVSSSALQTLERNKMNKEQILLLTEDLVKLYSYLQEETDSLSATLQGSFSKMAWERLNQITLARLVLFNGRRGDETEQITVEGYQSKQDKTDQVKEIAESLRPVEKMLCSTFTRVEIQEGKKGRKVHVLLTPAIQKSIDLLLKWRRKAGVHHENPFLFARPNFESLNPVKSSSILRRLANKAELAKPEYVTSTKYRKHVATICRVLNFSENDIDIMASIMGREAQIHQSFYRLPQETLQIARMGRLLNAFDNGTIGQFSGKPLDEISLDEELSSEDSDAFDEDEVAETAKEIDKNHDGLVDDTGTSILKSLSGKKSVKHSGKIHRLNSEQTATLRNFFQTNVALKQELRRRDCLLAIEKHSCLTGLGWKKIKNTVHNWITLEKKKTVTIFPEM